MGLLQKLALPAYVKPTIRAMWPDTDRLALLAEEDDDNEQEE